MVFLWFPYGFPMVWALSILSCLSRPKLQPQETLPIYSWFTIKIVADASWGIQKNKTVNMYICMYIYICIYIRTIIPKGNKLSYHFTRNPVPSPSVWARKLSTKIPSPPSCVIGIGTSTSSSTCWCCTRLAVIILGTCTTWHTSGSDPVPSFLRGTLWVCQNP